MYVCRCCLQVRDVGAVPELCLQVAPEDAFVSDELAVALEKPWGGLG